LLSLISLSPNGLQGGKCKSLEPPVSSTFSGDRQEQLETVLHTLDDRELGIIQRRFGLLGEEPGTLEEVGRVFGLTRERIRQIESKTLCKLRHPTRAQQLLNYPE
jgi:DNA-directed RNA polymerase sigma subunit (sigma70/sigma32)